MTSTKVNIVICTRTAHYLNGPLIIDRTTQLSIIGGALGDQNCLLISHTDHITPVIMAIRNVYLAVIVEIYSSIDMGQHLVW